ncbi:MAG: peroxidase-related enzyme [Actinomycetota bacterium]|nr:peroxidase-related enzyme [Actinomycetota bacterium]
MASFSRFAVPTADTLETLPEDVRARILAVQEKTGFVPNVFLALARRPAEFRAFVAYHDAVMESDSGLSKADREMIVVATSAERSCTYCVVAHGAILRVRAKDPLIADLVATNWRQAPLTSRQRAMLSYAVKLSLIPEEIGDDDTTALHDAGFEDDDIWDIAAVVALFALSNRMAHALALAPNKEFHLLGRLPRS